MKTFAVCELEEHIKEIVRLVRENQEIIEVTDGGEVIALLMPVLSGRPEWLREKPEGGMWASYDRLVAELGIRWPEGVSAVDAVRDVRREL